MKITSNAANLNHPLLNSAPTQSFLDKKIFLLGLVILAGLITYLYFTFRPSNQLKNKNIKNQLPENTNKQTNTPPPQNQLQNTQSKTTSTQGNIHQKGYSPPPQNPVQNNKTSPRSNNPNPLVSRGDKFYDTILSGIQKNLHPPQQHQETNKPSSSKGETETRVLLQNPKKDLPRKKNTKAPQKTTTNNKAPPKNKNSEFNKELN